MKNIAYFISSHGFGHASRACAVMNELNGSGEYRFTIFSEVPLWFFRDSLKFEFNYEKFKSDVGLIQENPFSENLDATISALNKRFPVLDHELIKLSVTFLRFAIDLVICDISPVGILAAKSASLPSILIENFTWDWIYEPYQLHNPEFKTISDYLSSVFLMATYHLQTEPVCNRKIEFPLINPIYREPTKKIKNIRNELGVKKSETLVLITMGGIPFDIPGSLKIKDYNDIKIVIPGSNVLKEKHSGSVLFLPHHHRYYHPNLVHASDVIIGKIGYSTIAETYSAGLPFLYISRNTFRESPFLEDFVEKRMQGQKIGLDFFEKESWLDELLKFRKTLNVKKAQVNGAKEVSEFIYKIIVNH